MPRWAGLERREPADLLLRVRLVDEPMNMAEYLIHHEDVRRASASWGKGSAR